MPSKEQEKRNGSIHFELDVEFPEFKEGVSDILSVMKEAGEEFIKMGRKMIGAGEETASKMKKIEIK